MKTRFRLLTELYSFLLVWNYLLLIRFFLGFRLLTELYSFLLKYCTYAVSAITIAGFRLLMEYHSFLYWTNAVINHLCIDKFPSPYGVSFILIKQNHIFIEVERYFGFRLLMELYSFLHTSNLYCHFIDNQFPSPYGVIFILTEISKRGSWFRYRIVSVSLWSIIHSYYFFRYIHYNNSSKFPSPYGVSFILIVQNWNLSYCKSQKKVSVSLWSIIHSYKAL